MPEGKGRPHVPGVPLLNNGDRMKQPEFHRRYRRCPEDKKFELIGGIVYMASPLSAVHSDYDEELGFALGLYRRATSGVGNMHNATTILGEESEPQPDLGLRILPAFGGRSTINDAGYFEGPPELLAEIAVSSRAIDMYGKRDDYEQAGVQEYLVLCVEEQELRWFHFHSGREIKPTAEGIYCSRVFPGLWIDGRALLARDSGRIAEVIQQGLASRQHAAFVKRLETARRKKSKE
jgi:Uma2 family endonuclease